MNATAAKDAIELGRDWAEADRWNGIDRDYAPEDVLRLRGSLRIEHTLARHGAEKLWRLLAEEDYVAALGALTGGQAVQMAKAGLQAIYLSGWQVAADGNLAADVYPDQSLYPANSVPAMVKRLNNALMRADRIEWAEGKADPVDYLLPIVADAEAGFGGPLNAFELMKGMIESGAAGVHFEDQLSSEKKCGHLGGKVLVPTGQFIRTLLAARLAADMLGVPTLLVARTDADAATLITSDATSAMPSSSPASARPRGSTASAQGVEAAIARGLAYAPYADLRLDGDVTPDLGRGARVRGGDPRRVPGQAARLQLLAVVQLAPAPRRRDDRALPARARRDGLQVPVHHARGLPRAQRVDVRARPRLRRRGDARLRAPAGAGVRDSRTSATRRRSISARSAPAGSTRSRRQSPAAPARHSRSRARPRRSSSTTATARPLTE